MRSILQKESDEQKALIGWSKYHHICKDYLFSIPNGGTRNIREAISLKAEGVKKGVSDLFLSYPSNGYHGLYIEMKRKGGKLTEDQKKWLELVSKVGYGCGVCYSFEEAKKFIEGYL